MKICNKRMVPDADPPFVVFLFGVRINKRWMVHKWWPVRHALDKMLTELQNNPHFGYLGHEYWPGNACLTLQYWRSIDALKSYARARGAQHFPAWYAFNDKYSSSGAVGIWHESYLIQEGTFEAVYKNMPYFGLGRSMGINSGEGPKITSRNI